MSKGSSVTVSLALSLGWADRECMLTYWFICWDVGDSLTGGGIGERIRFVVEGMVLGGEL